MIENLHKKILASIFVGILILAILSFYANVAELINAIKSFNWLLIAPILLLSILNYLIRFARWEFYLKKLGIKISTFKSLIVFISGLTMSVTPGKIGEALKSYLLKLTDNVQISRSAPIVIAERLTDFLALLLLALFGAFYFNYGKGVIAGVGITLIAGTLAVSKREFFNFILNWTKKLTSDNLSQKINTAYDSIAELLKIKTLIPTVLISTLSWFSECVGFYLTVKAYLGAFSLNLATFIYSFSTIAGAVSMLPGGLGLTEGSMTGLLIINKVQKETAVAITIIIRFATLWFAVGLGLIALYIFQKRFEKFKNESKS
ncbi:conserved hypothetical protein [Candidatus Thermokryptus mobilis]|uniref:Lysylphosphatidylglycerol synthase TM region n=1 Tax=Candidatus Thermokryptus mobilis TaxID=1643428 RepID=A0A0S4MX84_9BACT|nr:lysylphosphatidylglycerol synthase transmembrane domain-containing protein [Candidatus Thermokryptus mobilis]CUU03578.1 conserved hypothetical protein [Candidatus Thermokryptus mobilis]